MMYTRGRVELRLEAKAKDTKKIQGQGQPFRGQIPLEAKNKNVGGQSQRYTPQAQVFSKKMSSKIFSGDLQNKTSSENFFR